MLIQALSILSTVGRFFWGYPSQAGDGMVVSILISPMESSKISGYIMDSEYEMRR